MTATKLSIAAIEVEVIEEFGLFDDWMDKYAYLIDVGKTLSPINEAYKIPAFSVKGCQSNVWLHAKNCDGAICYEADSDAMITKGLIALLVRILDGQQADDIVSADLGFVDAIGLRQHLSSNRSNGLSAMIRQMKNYAQILAHSRTEQL